MIGRVGSSEVLQDVLNPVIAALIEAALCSNRNAIERTTTFSVSLQTPVVRFGYAFEGGYPVGSVRVTDNTDHVVRVRVPINARFKICGVLIHVTAVIVDAGHVILDRT